MKKLLATVLGVMLVLSLTGCGEEPILISDTDEPIVWDLEDVDEVEKPADTAATDDVTPFVGYWQNDEFSQWLLIDENHLFAVFNDYNEPIVTGLVSISSDGTAKLIDGNGDTYMELDVSESGDLLDINDMRVYRTATSEPSGEKPEGLDAFAGKWFNEENNRYIEILSDGTWCMYNSEGDAIDEGTASLREDSLVLIDGMGEGVLELERTLSGDLISWDDMATYTPVDEIPAGN